MLSPRKTTNLPAIWLHRMSDQQPTTDQQPTKQPSLESLSLQAVTKSEKSKTESSQYYFFKTTPAEQAENYKPQQISQDDVAKIVPTSTEGASAWNAAGTWEEKDVSSWAHKTIKTMLKEIEFAFTDGSATVKSVSKCEGDATVVFSRGKKKVGFELNITIDFTGTHKGTPGIDGQLIIEDLAETSLDDFEWRIKMNEDSINASAVKFGVNKSAEKVLRSCVGKFVDEMKKQ